MRNTPFPTQNAGPLKKLLSLVGGVIILVLGLMFSVVVLIVVVAVGLMVWGFLWWKTREIRRVMREAQSNSHPSPPGGDVIEGEAVVVEESRASDRRVLSSGSREDC
jgi:hypothetical protein